MIELRDVSKRYGRAGEGQWVLRDVSLSIPPATSIAVLGLPESGKSTLIHLIAGIERPTSGTVQGRARIAWPRKFYGNLQPTLSGRQNAKFICRINGHTEDLHERLLRIERYAGLGAKFDAPLSGYGPELKMRLSFALSWVVDCDLYLADAFHFAGAMAFQRPEAARDELLAIAGRRGVLFAPASSRGEALAAQVCTAAIVVADGRATWHDDVAAALEVVQASNPDRRGRDRAQDEEVAAERGTSLHAIRRARATLLVLEKGLSGEPVELPEARQESLRRMGELLGVHLDTYDNLVEAGNAPEEGAKPVVILTRPGHPSTELFAGADPAEPR